MDREPVLIILAGLAAVVDAGLVMATTLDWLPWSGEQCAAVVAFVTAATALVGTALRAYMDSPATVAARVQVARLQGPQPGDLEAP